MIVVKVGGGEGIDFAPLCKDVASRVAGGEKIVLVHGASHATNILSQQLGTPAQFITSPSGHTSRRTDRRTLEIFQMACRGIVNQSLVIGLLKLGVNAVGISGVDARLWSGERKSAVRSVEDGRVRVIRDDYTGAIDHVEPGVMTTLLNAGYIPVLSPPAISRDFEPINVDADRAAAQTAVALKADCLLLLSNVPGLLREFPDESSLLRRVTRSELQAAEDMAQGRMKKKVLAAAEAINGGVSKVIIGDARRDSPISAALEGAGTVFA